jgi:hypothetical protein
MDTLFTLAIKLEFFFFFGFCRIYIRYSFVYTWVRGGIYILQSKIGYLFKMDPLMQRKGKEKEFWLYLENKYIKVVLPQ